MPRYAHLIAIPIDFALSAVQFAFAVTVLAPLSYISAALSSAFPLIDEPLKHFDLTFFAYDDQTFVDWVRAHPLVKNLFAFFYFSLIGQSSALILIGSFLRPGERNGEFIWLIIFSASFTCVIFTFTPALGIPGFIGQDHIDFLKEIRSGAWTLFSFDRVEGIVTFPSFHTTLAVLFTYIAARLHRWAFGFFATLNGLMQFTVPPMGGHYLIDMWGGAAVAGVSILSARKLCLPGKSRRRVTASSDLSKGLDLGASSIT